MSQLRPGGKQGEFSPLWQRLLTLHARKRGPAATLKVPFLVTNFYQLGPISYWLSTFQVSVTGGEHSKREPLLGGHSSFKV